jgi:ribonuclease P protein component
MLSAGHRLRRRQDFVAAIRGGSRAARGVLVVHLESRDEGGPCRIGFVIPKTVGGAVVRNTVRRRLRHLLSERLTDLPAGTDLVVRALPAAASRPFPDLSADLDAALTAARRPRRSS